MLESSGSTRKKEEVSILGLERKATFTKDNSKEEREMEKEPSGGPMAVGTKESSEMEYSQDGECYIVKAVTDSTKETGTTACLTAKGLNTSRTDSVTKAHSSKTNSTETVYFTKTTQ